MHNSSFINIKTFLDLFVNKFEMLVILCLVINDRLESSPSSVSLKECIIKRKLFELVLCRAITNCISNALQMFEQTVPFWLRLKISPECVSISQSLFYI